MGQGAFIIIGNASAEPVAVSYDSLVCMYNDGTDGSDFLPITGTVGPGQCLPANTMQYIEANNSGTCFNVDKQFNLKLTQGTSTATFMFSCQFDFTAQYENFTVNGLNTYQEISSGSLNASVTIAPGGQDRILVMIY